MEKRELVSHMKPEKITEMVYDPAFIGNDIKYSNLKTMLKYQIGNSKDLDNLVQLTTLKTLSLTIKGTPYLDWSNFSQLKNLEVLSISGEYRMNNEK